MIMRGDGRVFRRGRKFWVAYFVRGKEHREPGGATVGEARKLLRARLAEIHGGRFIGARAERVTVGEVLRTYVENRKVAGKKGIASIEHAVHVLTGRIGDWRAIDATLPRLERWVSEVLDEVVTLADGRRKRYARGTVKGWVAYLGAAFRVAKRAGLVARTLDLPALRVSNTREGFYSGDEFQALLRELPPAIGQVATFAYLTGWRRAEILGLTWAEIDRSSGVIRLADPRTKTDKPKIIPLTGPLAALIEARWKARRVGNALCPWVFHQDGRRLAYFHTAWNSACRRAGMPGRLLHDFRRTAVRDMTNAGVPAVVAMKITGHKTRAVFDRYHIVTTDDQAAALERTAEHRQAGGGKVTTIEGRARTENTDKTRTNKARG